MKHLTISIEYAGLSLPVIKNERGTELVPLKPVSDSFGLHWPSQFSRMKEDWTARFLGVCIQDIQNAGDQKREMVCIRLDRVAAYLMSLNPIKIRAAGNTTGADFLEARLNEWADALHDYETLGAAVNERHIAGQATLRAANAALKLIRAKAATVSKADRGLIDGLLQNLSRENGIPYQPDLVPSAE
ncbi:phage antirepressor N-terminal domain-containing protein [Uliginosibacterium paludis]|uniref:Phage antirepressor N-terminal domain-containing protein n=1 Tax=Uliginosibacterium paludis TaxID=1615952 RepID=A0ABV2CUH7_9RHOO